MRRVSLVSAVLLALALASPAWATAPPFKPINVFLSPHSEPGKAHTHSCAKGGPQKQVKLPGARAIGDLAHKAVVACEQPPRSQPFLSGLKHTEAVALLALVG
jgi:hypothetical protein